MLRMPPEVRPIMAKNARPSYLKILFITQLDTSAGAAQRMHIPYVFAYSIFVGVLPKSHMSGVKKMVPKMRIAKPEKSAE